MRRFAGIVALLFASGRAMAQTACWAPDRSQAPDAAVARSAPVTTLNAMVARVSAAFKRNAAFTQIPNTRLMVTSYIGYANPGFGPAVRVSAGLYPPNTWREGCTLMSSPEFFNHGHVHVRLNSPAEIFQDVSPRLRDDALTAYAQPTGALPAGGETYFGSIRGVVLTPDRRPAWVPVTTAEWLAFRERAASKKMDELSAGIAEQKSSIERYRTDMERRIARAPDGATKAQLRKAMEENTEILRTSSGAANASFAKLSEDTEKALREIRDERSGLSAAQLGEQARVSGVALVKVNPALAGGSRTVNLIVVRAVANNRAMAAPLEQAVREMDFTSLRALFQ